MYDFDVKSFWAENKKCFEPFSTNKPRIPISFGLDDHFLLEELSLPSTIGYYNDFKYRQEMNIALNDKVERVLGKRFYSENKIEAPTPVRFEVIMGSHWSLTEGGTPWLESTVKDIEDVKRIINCASNIDMKKEAFPDGWHEMKEQYEKQSGVKLKLGGDGSRGPATMATSILGTTNTCLFIMDEPDIMKEFFMVLADKLIEYHYALMQDTSNCKAEGYWLTDDNCYLFPPDAYLKFCAPVLEKIFNAFAPLPEHARSQHSDSNMGHLMSILHDLGVNSVNLGPEIHPSEIRKAMPRAVIHGHLPPFTLRNGTPQDIIDTVRRDIDTVGGDGGLVESPAGSVAGGTPLENLRIYMWAVHTFGRYNG